MWPNDNLYNSDWSDIKEELEQKCGITSDQKENNEKNNNEVNSNSDLFGPFLPNLIFYFASNIPTNISDNSFTVLLNSVYPNSTFSRIPKSPQCGFIGVPKSLVDADMKLQAAQKSENGTAILLPSGAAIFLRPRKCDVRKGSYNNNNNNNTQISSNKPNNNMQSNLKNDSLTRLSQLESKIAELEKSNQELRSQQNSISHQVQLIGSNMGMKFNQMENVIFSANRSTNNNISALVNQISNLTQLIAKNVQQPNVLIPPHQNNMLNPNQLSNNQISTPFKQSRSPMNNYVIQPQQSLQHTNNNKNAMNY